MNIMTTIHADLMLEYFGETIKIGTKTVVSARAFECLRVGACRGIGVAHPDH
ncbi:hypothetical protein KTH_00340 [Thermosporothrix hazakensis]|nr:hypothetical protein KTH_00340 [Thermosporothrix hazakensis]